MILKKGNVERVADSDRMIEKLVSEGYEAIDGEFKTGEKDEKPLSKLKVTELKDLAKEKGIECYDSLNKDELLKVLKDVE